MGDLLAGWRFAVRRLLANGRLMLVAALGVLVAATLLAVTPIYAAAMSDLGLRFRLERQLPRPSDHLAYIEVDRLLLGNPADRARRDALERVLEARVGWLGATVTEDKTPALDLTFLGTDAAAGGATRPRWGAYVYVLSGFEQHTEVVEGRLPGPSSAGLEVVLPDGFQRHAKVGDTVRLGGPSYDDCAHVPPSQDAAVARDEVICEPTIVGAMSGTATIVGFVRPRDAGDLRWQNFAGGWRVPEQPTPRGAQAPAPVPGAPLLSAEERGMSLITTREQFYGAFAARMPELGTRQRTGVVLDARALRLVEVPRAIDDLLAWRTDVTERLQLFASWNFATLDVLQGFRNTQTFSQIPLLLILLQVVGIVLYYVVMVMAMLLDRQAEEIGVLRSRGATTGQLLGQHLVEGALLALPAALAGPWLAARIVEAIGRTPMFATITGGAPLVASVTPIAVLLGATGAVLALFAILVPAYGVARRGILASRREAARPAGRGFVQRYYLDLGVVVLAGFLLWQLRQRGSVFDPGSVGGWSTDPLLPLSPLVITVAVALVMLRLYPPIVRLAVAALLLFRGTAVAIGLRRAGRSPAAYARLMLLLVMSVSVGTFAASYGPTVGRSLDERVRYEVGVDARALIDRPDRNASDRGLTAVRALPGVQDAAAVYRGTVTTPGGGSVTVLALDPARAQTMLWSREDFAARPLTDLLREVQSDLPPGGGIDLPAGTTALGLSLRGTNIERASLQARLRDANGAIIDALFQLPEASVPAAAPGWTTAVATIPEWVTPPLTLVAVPVSERIATDLRRAGSLQIDRITARVAGRAAVIEDFERPFAWSLFGAPARDDTFRLVDGTDAASGSRFAEWRWSGTITPGTQVFALNDPAVPLGAIMNPAAMAAFGTTDGGVAMLVLNGVQVPVLVHGSAQLFPTLDPSRPFVVLNDSQLQSIAGTVGAPLLRHPNELWLRFHESASIEDRRATLRALELPDAPLRIKSNPLLQASMLDDTNADPTLQAAGSGILSVAFIAVLGLSAVGVVVTLVLSARARAVEFAVLRAVGASGAQILRGLLIEWGIVLIAGAAVGLVLGRTVAALMLRFLEVTERGERVVPPFIVHTDWIALGVGVGLLTAVVVVTLLTSWRAAMRGATGARLRLTE